MAGNVEVLEEAGVDRPAPGDGRRSWLVPAAAFVVGAFAGAVFFGPVVAPDASQDMLPDDTPAAPLAPGEEDGAVGVARAVPGFEHAVVAIVQGPSGVDYLLWPPARSPDTLGLPVTDADSVTIDPSGLWLATLTPLPDAEGGLFSSGRATAVRPIITGVHSYAWHDSALGRMAILREDQGSWAIYEAAAFPSPELAADLGPADPGTLVGFGPWGWALQGTTSFAVLNSVGRQDYPGQFLDSSPEGFLLADGGIVRFASGGSTVDLAVAAASAGRISPDGTRAALLDAEGITIVNLDGSAEHRYEMSSADDQLEWAGDRFVVSPRSPRGIWILDTETGEATAHLTDLRVSWAGVISLRS